MTRGPWPDAGVLETWARAALARWTAPVGAAVRLITISENASFRVTTPAGPWAVLRLYRPGRRRRREIDSELAWMTVLAAAARWWCPAIFMGAMARRCKARSGRMGRVIGCCFNISLAKHRASTAI